MAKIKDVLAAWTAQETHEKYFAARLKSGDATYAKELGFPTLAKAIELHKRCVADPQAPSTLTRDAYRLMHVALGEAYARFKMSGVGGEFPAPTPIMDILVFEHLVAREAKAEKQSNPLDDYEVEFLYDAWCHENVDSSIDVVRYTAPELAGSYGWVLHSKGLTIRSGSLQPTVIEAVEDIPGYELHRDGQYLFMVPGSRDVACAVADLEAEDHDDSLPVFVLFSGVQIYSTRDDED